MTVQWHVNPEVVSKFVAYSEIMLIRINNISLEWLFFCLGTKMVTC